MCSFKQKAGIKKYGFTPPTSSTTYPYQNPNMRVTKMGVAHAMSKHRNKQKHFIPFSFFHHFETFHLQLAFLKKGQFTLQTNALSFYKSQNVLCWSKFFVPDQKFIYILWHSQTFCARQKDDLHSAQLVFAMAQKFLKRH